MIDPQLPPDEPSPRKQGSFAPSVVARQEMRSHRLLLLGIRLLYLVLLVTVTMLPLVGAITDAPEESGLMDYILPFVAALAFGVIILVIDAAMPNKRLATVFGVYLGIIAGLVGALAIGVLLDLVAESWDLTKNPWLAYRGMIKLAIGITLCYLAVSIVLTTKDDLRLVIPYVEFAKQVRGVRPLLLDTSVLIDGRIESLAGTGFLETPLVVAQFVVDELQTLADSGDRLKRARGRRGLAVLNKLRTHPRLDLSIEDATVAGTSVDQKLLELASKQSVRILTTDYNLARVAEIQDVPFLNLNELAITLKPQAMPGETLQLEVVKRGESPEQGIGYMPDGMMVVIEGAAARIGEEVSVIVTNSLQTSAGRMIFGKLEGADDEHDDAAPDVEHIAQAATGQARMTERPEPRGRAASSRRNPRR